MKRSILGATFALVLVLSFSPMISVPASADPAATVTPAAGGGAISADTSAGAPGQAWTSLGPITISEGAPNEIDDGVFILTIPAGFEFNAASEPDVVTTGLTPELQANTPASITATTITVMVTDNSTTEADTLTIGGVTPIQVRPTAGTPLANGNITMTAGTIAGVVLNVTNFGTLNEVAGAVNTLTIVTQPSDALVGAAIAPPVQVRAADQFNNIIAGQNIAAALIAGTGTLSGTSPRATNASGIATFNDLSIDTAGPGKVLRFSADGTTVDSNPFNISVAGITVNPTAGLVTTEAGGSDNFTVVLDSQPTDNVTVWLSSNDPSEGTILPTSLTFTNADWNTPQTVTITGVDDAIVDGDVVYTIITTPAASTDPNYNGFDASDVAVTNTDDDVATVEPDGPAVPPPAPAAPRVSPTPPRTLNPAQLSARYLSVNPQQTTAGQPVTVTTNVVNTGDEAGSYNVVLKINGQVEQTRTVNVGPQGTQPVKFTVTRAQPGTYAVNIDDQRRSFIITGVGSKPGAETGEGIMLAAAAAAIVILAGLLVAAARRRPRG